MSDTAPTRRPAISRPATHPAEDLPARPTAAPEAKKPRQNEQGSGAPVAPLSAAATAGSDEPFTEVTNTRLRKSTRTALDRAILIQQLRTSDRSHSIQSILDAAINEYIDKHQLRDV